jgi:hypothetical protein
MKKKARSDRTHQQCQRLVERWSKHDRRLERPGIVDERLASCKRAALRKQSRRVALEIDSLARRAALEAPEVRDRLRRAAEALQLLGARLELAEEPRRGSDSGHEEI